MSASKIWREAGKKVVEARKKEFDLFMKYTDIDALAKNTDDIPTPSDEIVEEARAKWKKSYNEMIEAQKYYNSLPYPEICNETGELLSD